MTSNIPDKFSISQFILGIYIIIIFTPLAIDNLLQLPSARAQNAIVDDPNLDKEDVAKALIDKAKALEKLGDHTGALESYDNASAINPTSTRALIDKGQLLEKMGDHTGALESYGQALVINPNSTRALIDKGGLLEKVGDHTRAYGIV